MTATSHNAQNYAQTVLARAKSRPHPLSLFNTGITLPANPTVKDYADYPIMETEAVITDDGAKPVMLKRPAKGQICVIDWLNITFKATTLDDDSTRTMLNAVVRSKAIASRLSTLLVKILGFGISKQNNNGSNFYDLSFELEHKAGQICIGGQNDSVLIALSGVGCTYGHDGWEADLYNWLYLIAKDPKITRIDLAHDDLYGDYTDLAWFARQDDKGGFTCGGRKPQIEMRGNWKRPSGKGRSLYIGTRKSSKYCRIYEKGKQLGDSNSQWVRAEVEYKSKSIYIPLHVLINPSPFFLASYPCFHIFDPQIKTDLQKFERLEREQSISFADALDITRHQFGRYLYAFRQEFAKNGATDTQLLDLLTQEKHEYPERLDTLTITMPTLGATHGKD